MNLDKVLFGHITQGMALLFTIGILVLFIYNWRELWKHNNGYTHKRYMTLTLPNILFHILASFALLMLLHELSEVIINSYIPKLKGSQTFHWTLSFLIGMLGSPFVAMILEKGRKKINKKDANINHIHKIGGELPDEDDEEGGA